MTEYVEYAWQRERLLQNMVDDLVRRYWSGRNLPPIHVKIIELENAMAAAHVQSGTLFIDCLWFKRTMQGWGVLNGIAETLIHELAHFAAGPTMPHHNRRYAKECRRVAKLAGMRPPRVPLWGEMREKSWPNDSSGAFVRAWEHRHTEMALSEQSGFLHIGPCGAARGGGPVGPRQTTGRLWRRLRRTLLRLIEQQQPRTRATMAFCGRKRDQEGY